MVWLHAHSPTSANPSALGVYLERLTVSTLSPPAPASGTTVSPEKFAVTKNVELDGLSAYTNPLGSREEGYLRPPDCGDNTAVTFILRPLKVRGNLRIDDADSSGGQCQAKEPPPLAAVLLDVEALTLQVDVNQYAMLNDAISALLMSQRRFRFRTMRPTTSVLEDPGAWWRYAIRYFSPISTRKKNKTGGSIVLRVKVMSFEYNTSPHTVYVIPTPRTRERV